MVKSLFLIASILVLATCQSPQKVSLDPPFVPDYALNRFENTIVEYEARDAARPPALNAIAFGGSSSMFNWKSLEQDMAPLPVRNYGFGGSTFPEMIYYADRTLLKYRPSKVIIYCENDIFGEKQKTPKQTCDDYIRLTQKLRATLPRVEIWFISLKPSPARWGRWQEAQQVNQLIQDFIKTDKKHHYIDIAPVMLHQGRPDPTIFLEDSLHMNAEGYKRWTKVVKKAICE